MSVPRVLHCIYDNPSNPWLGGGGAHRVHEIYRRLAGEVEVTVAAGAYPGAEDGVLEGVRYRYLGARRPYAWSRLTYARAATSLLRRGEYDAAFFDFSVYTPIRVPRSGPVAHVVHMSIGATAAARWGGVLGRLVRGRELRMLSRAREVQTTSHWMAEWLRPRVARGAGIRVVRSGVDDSYFAVERSESTHVLYYGRFDLHQKGLDVLLDTADGVLTAHPGIRLVLAGRGKDAGEVRRRVAALSHASRVEVREDPTREAVQTLMAGALCLVHPSRFEGLPMVPAEAMAAGVPVIATDVGALREIVGADRDGAAAAGRLVPPGDGSGLESAIGAVLADAELRSAMSSRARSAARRFSWAEVAADHLSHVRDLSRGA